jgi:hypothetical protein
MPVFIPVIIGGELALEGLILGGAAVYTMIQTQRALSRSRARSEPQVQCCCPPCNPPVGTMMWEIHRVPPSAPHHPCEGDHVHWFRMQQNPYNCQCFKQRNARPVQCIDVPGSTPDFPPGTVPLPPG